jgi:predicted Rossmann fold flavoprotein
MMAAGTAAKSGSSVILLEKMPSLGRKLLITGQGRCNITNNLEVKKFIADCGPRARFLFGPLTRFGFEATLKFFEDLGLKCKLERGGRYFPESDSSRDVLEALERYLAAGNVRVITNARVTGIRKEREGFSVTAGTEVYRSAKLIIATGGKSYPGTGSTGDGYAWAEGLGHKVSPPNPSDVPLNVKENFIRELQGLSLKNAELTFSQDSKKIKFFGEMLFTHYGISGPIVLDASRALGPWLDDGPVDCKLDLKPALSEDMLDKRLQREIPASGKKTFKIFIKEYLPAKLIPIFINLCGIDGDLRVNQLNAGQRKKVIELLKEIRFTITSLRGFDEAVVTAGGVDTDQIDQSTMESKKNKGLYFCGEILDLDGPCGGYNLQIAWTTGFLAGKSAGGE